MGPSKQEKIKSPKKMHSISPELLATFWELAVDEEEARLNGCGKLLNFLEQKTTARSMTTCSIIQQQIECKELDYTLHRLIRGLASNRQCACPGFAMALTQVLRSFPSIGVTCILKMAEMDLEITDHDCPKEKGDVHRARVMVYLCIIQSDLIKTASPVDVDKIIKGLLMIRQQKSFMQQLCVNAIGQISNKISEELFKKVVFPLLSEELQTGWDDCISPDTLLLLILISRAQPGIITPKFLKKHWTASSIVKEENFKHLGKIIMNSSPSNHPALHSVCLEIMRSALESKSFDKFWNMIVIDEILSNPKVNKKQMVLQLVSHVFHLGPTHAQIKTILIPAVRDLIMNNIASSKQLLHLVALKTNEDILKFAIAGDAERQMAVVSSLLDSNIQYDLITKTKTIGHITQALKPEACKWMADQCMALIHGTTVFGKQKCDVSVCIWAISQLSALCNHLSHAEQLNMIKFMFLHAFFTVNHPSSDIVHCESIMVSPTPKLQDLLKGAFTKGLQHMLSVHSPGEKKTEHLSKNVNALLDVLNYCQKLFNNSPKIVCLQKEWKDEAKDEWNKMYETVHKIHTKLQKVKEMTLCDQHAFELLFLQLGFHLFIDQRYAIDGLQDLHICYQKAFVDHKRRKSVATGDAEPEWIEVITDLFLSLLTLNSHLVRSVVNDVFKLLSPHMTTSAVKLILDVIKSDKPEDDEDGVLVFEDDKKDDNDNESILSENCTTEDATTEDDDDDDDGDKDENSSDEEDDNDDSDDDVEDDVDVNFRATVKAALGQTADDSDKEGDDMDEDLDDEAMFRIDDALGEAFRSMAKGRRKKEDEDKKEQMMQYRMKCLDLLTILLKSNEDLSAAILLELLIPLLHLIDSSSKDKKLNLLCTKASHVFQDLCKHKRDPAVRFEDRDQINLLFKELVKPSNVLPPNEVSRACTFLIKLSSHIPEHARTRGDGDDQLQDYNAHIQELFDVLKGTLKDFMVKRDNHLTHVFFTQLMSKHPVFLWPLSKDLLTYMSNKDVRIFCRTQACTMLNSMINKSLCHELNKDDLSSFCSQLTDNVIEGLENTVNEDKTKMKYLLEILTCFVRMKETAALVNISMVANETLLSLLEQLKEKSNKVIIKLCNRAARNKSENQTVPTTNGNHEKKKNKDSGSQVAETSVKLPKTPKSAKRSIENGDIGQTPKIVNESKDENTNVLPIKTPKSAKKKHKLENIEVNDMPQKTPKSKKKHKLENADNDVLSQSLQSDDATPKTSKLEKHASGKTSKSAKKSSKLASKGT